MSYEADPRVDEYIDALPDWQRQICREVREVIHQADPELAFSRISCSTETSLRCWRRRTT